MLSEVQTSKVNRSDLFVQYRKRVDHTLCRHEDQLLHVERKNLINILVIRKDD